LDYSKKPPHAASDEAKIKVEQLQKELANPSVENGIATDLGPLNGVPLRSLAMLICKVKMGSDVAVDTYPRRPPMTTDVLKVVYAPSGRLAIPIFLIHFS
jgi:hypothetical protein